MISSTAIHRWFHISKLDWIDWWPHDQTDGKGKGEKGNLIFPPRSGIFRQTVGCNSTHRCKVKGLMPAKPCTNLVNKVEIVNFESGVLLEYHLSATVFCLFFNWGVMKPWQSPNKGIFRQTVGCNSTHRCKVKGLMPAKPCTNLVNKVEIVNYESGVILCRCDKYWIGNQS